MPINYWKFECWSEEDPKNTGDLIRVWVIYDAERRQVARAYTEAVAKEICDAHNATVLLNLEKGTR